jgi:hypothetical protein
MRSVFAGPLVEPIQHEYFRFDVIAKREAGFYESGTTFATAFRTIFPRLRYRLTTFIAYSFHLTILASKVYYLYADSFVCWS